MASKVKVSLPDDGTGAVKTAADGDAANKSAANRDSATPNPDGSVHVEFHKKAEKEKGKKSSSKGRKADEQAPSAEQTAPDATQLETKPEAKPATKPETTPAAPPPAETAEPAKTTETPKTTEPAAQPPIQKHRTILSPFAPPHEKASRLKIFVWGGSGAGKTFFALQFPGVAIVDADNGTDPYKEIFKFDVKKTTNVDEVRRLVEWLATNEHDYTTFEIDPITILWESLQKKWSDIFLERNTKSKGYKHEFYEMQVRDWQALKSDLKSLLRQILALDMNIVVTARSKTQYKGGSGDFMVADGETFDGEKALPYMFDTVLHLDVVNGKRVAHCTKDRWNAFPMNRAFELDYSLVEKIWAPDRLARLSQTVVLPPEEEVVRDVPEKHKASIQQMVEIALLVNECGFSEEQVEGALAARNCTALDQLTEDQAAEIIGNLSAIKAVSSAPPDAPSQ